MNPSLFYRKAAVGVVALIAVAVAVFAFWRVGRPGPAAISEPSVPIGPESEFEELGVEQFREADAEEIATALTRAAEAELPPADAAEAGRAAAEFLTLYREWDPESYIRARQRLGFDRAASLRAIESLEAERGGEWWTAMLDHCLVNLDPQHVEFARLPDRPTATPVLRGNRETTFALRFPPDLQRRVDAAPKVEAILPAVLYSHGLSTRPPEQSRDEIRLGLVMARPEGDEGWIVTRLVMYDAEKGVHPLP